MVRSTFDNPPLLQNHDLVSPHNRTQPVSDHEACASREQFRQSALEAVLRNGVDRAGGLIEDQNARVGQQRPRAKHTI
jgi:hypothetical protein